MDLMKQLYNMEKVETGLELLTLVGAVRDPDDQEGGLYLIFQGFTEEDQGRHAVVWVAQDAEGNGNGALHIMPQSETDPGKIIE